MEAAELEVMPSLEQDLPALLDERVIAAEEAKRDGRETPTRQTPVIQSEAAAAASSASSPLRLCCGILSLLLLCRGWQEHALRLLPRSHAGHEDHREEVVELHLRPSRPPATDSTAPACPCAAHAGSSDSPFAVPLPASLCAQRSQHGVSLALRHPHVTLSIFPSGKVICMGARSEASAIIGCRKGARLIQKIPDYAAVTLSDFRIHNVMASGALGYRVDLAAIARHPLHEQQVEYDPGHFPGLRYKLQDDFIRPPAAAPVPVVKPEVKPESSSAAAAIAPFSWLQRPTVAAASSSSSSASSLTLTLYYSGLFTIIGARDEASVYRQFHRLSRMFFRFAQPASLPPVVQGGGYDAWLQWAEGQEKARGRMGWEEEAERVREELMRRERRKERMSSQPEQQQAAAAAAGRTELRVKQEPGVKEEQKTEADSKEEKAEPMQEERAREKDNLGREEKQTAAAAAATPAAPSAEAAAERKEGEEQPQDKSVIGIGVATGPAGMAVADGLIVVEAVEGNAAADDTEAEVEWE